jgi:hypothetical protein
MSINSYAKAAESHEATPQYHRSDAARYPHFEQPPEGNIMNMVRPLALAALSVVLLASVPAVAQPSGGTMDAGPGRMQARNAQMQSMMDQAQHAKTPAERRKFMAEHMKVMQEQMAAMHSMMGPGGMMGQNQGSPPADLNAASQMQMMQQRMNMMQQMMEQMLQEQQLMMKPAR